MSQLPIKAVIFDFDGVILDSANIKSTAFRKLFNEYPEHIEAIYSYHIENQGISRYVKFRWIYECLLRKEYTEDVGVELGNRFSNIVLQQVMDAPFIQGSDRLLLYLKENNINSFIASGTPDSELNHIVDQRGLRQFFQAVYGSDRSKEQIIRLILSNNDLQAQDVLFIGDATTDHEAAITTGVNFLAVHSNDMIEYWAKWNISPLFDLEPINGLLGSYKIA